MADIPSLVLYAAWAGYIVVAVVKGNERVGKKKGKEKTEKLLHWVKKMLAKQKKAMRH